MKGGEEPEEEEGEEGRSVCRRRKPKAAAKRLAYNGIAQTWQANKASSGHALDA